MVENTSKRDPMLHLLGSLAEGQSGYIEGMEAEGQRQFVASAELMPADGPWAVLAELGFGEPQRTEDDLFVRSTLPAGWRKVATDHAMWSNVEDERGLPRVGVFYKGAFYDRSAFCHVIGAGRHLAMEAIYGDAPPARPEKWHLLTEGERASYRQDLDAYLQEAEAYPDVCRRRGRVQALRAAVATDE